MRSKIVEKFRLEGETVEIPLLKRGSFNAVLKEKGVKCNIYSIRQIALKKLMLFA